jgi:hypothetical protein
MTEINMRTTGRFPATAIASAAKDCLKEIEADRKKETAEVLAKHRKAWRFNWRRLRFVQFERTENEIRAHLRRGLDFSLFNAENKYPEQYRVAKKLRVIGEAAPIGGELIVSAQDMSALATFYKPPAKKRRGSR